MLALTFVRSLSIPITCNIVSLPFTKRNIIRNFQQPDLVRLPLSVKSRSTTSVSTTNTTSKMSTQNDPHHSLNSSLPSAADLLSFYNLVGQLKLTKRTGWVIRNIPKPESVSDHMYRMSMMAMSHPTLNPSERITAIKMCLAHDLAESTVGDITPHDGISNLEKQKRERAAMLDIRDNILKSSPAAHELYDLWEEYEAGKSDIAILVKDIDKLEMIIQADEYEQKHDTNLEEFFQSTKDKIKTPAMKDVEESLRNRRSQRLNSNEQDEH